jgi:glycosyltransferase involved in cell wall biosynthesis
MPHGNFDGVYPVPRRRDVVLAELGLDPTKPVFCCLGYLRAYKGLELACAAVHRVGRDVQLIIGGPPYKRHDLGPLRQWIAKMPQARLIERRLTEQEFADITAVSDAVLLPYLRVTTSGALLAAWSLGTGAIASDLPFFREIRDGVEGALQLFRPDDERDLVRAIEAYTGVPREQRQRSARSAAERYAWDTCVTPVAAWLEERRRSRAAANARSAED